MNQEQGLTRQRAFSELVRSPHGKLEEYLPIGRQAAREDPEFFAHLVAWNAKKGQVRDAQVALPLVALDGLLSDNGAAELRENSLAHLAKLSPRDLLRGLRFAKNQKLNGRRQAIPKLVARYLHNLESNAGKWERTAVQHRRTLHELYALAHVKPQLGWAYRVLFNEDENGVKMTQPIGVFSVIANLKNLDGLEAAGEVINRRLPFLIAAPALGKKLQDPAILAALIDRMTPSELTIHMKMLEKLGVRKNPVLRATLENAMTRVASGTSNAAKLSQAADAVEDDDLKEKIHAAQEKKLDKSGIEGDWLVLADKSSSMHTSIDLARELSAILARMAKGNVYLVFFDTNPRFLDVTGKTLEEIKRLTVGIVASGSTSIGVGVRYISEKHLSVDGIVIVSDGGENTAPSFAAAYGELTRKLDRQVPVYFYHVPGDGDALSVNCSSANIEVHQFPINSSADYYSLPNIVQSMRTNRYSLVDEIMETPLLTLDQVLSPRRQPAHAKA